MFVCVIFGARGVVAEGIVVAPSSRVSTFSTSAGARLFFGSTVDADAEMSIFFLAAVAAVAGGDARVRCAAPTAFAG